MAAPGVGLLRVNMDVLGCAFVGISVQESMVPVAKEIIPQKIFLRFTPGQVAFYNAIGLVRRGFGCLDVTAEQYPLVPHGKRDS